MTSNEGIRIILVDATAFYRTLLGGAAQRVFFECESNTEFITTQYTLEEVYEHIPEIAESVRCTEDELLVVLAALPFCVLGEDAYSDTMERAKTIMSVRDPEDVHLLALYYALDKAVVWSDDNHFIGINGVAQSTTAQMLPPSDDSVTTTG